MKRIALVLLAVVIGGTLVLPGPVAAHHKPWHNRPKDRPKPPPPPPTSSCRDDVDASRSLTLTVNREPATGRFALPADTPNTLVVFAHGYGHTTMSWEKHITRVARQDGVVAVGMEYRGIKISPDANGDGLPESRGWNVMSGAEDSIAAAQYFERNCKSINKVILMGVSMGGNTSGLAVALAGSRVNARRSDGSPLFDYWIDVAGAVNLLETYAEARLAAPADGYARNVYEDIEKETGGSIEDNFNAYHERTVVARIRDIQRAKLDGAIVIHGVDDGLVPYNQGREMATLLGASEIPTEMITIGRRSPESEKETTLTGRLFGRIDPTYKSPLAGNASEKSTTHIVMVTAFARLSRLIDGFAPESYDEIFVDGEEGPQPIR